MKIKNKILLLTVFVLLFVLAVVGYTIEQTVITRFENQIAESAMGIAQSVAEIPAVQNSLGKPSGYQLIQPVTERIRKNTGADYIVVFDMNRVRYSHPVPERIGETFVGGDEVKALKGQQYVSRGKGTLGPSLRAFVPIYREGKQVGVVAVGILLTDVKATVDKLQRWLIFAILLGLIVGVVGANLLAENIKKAMFGLEPQEISDIVHEREAFLESVKEGIIAVNKDGKITFSNSEAKRIFNLSKDSQGIDIRNLYSDTRLLDVLASGEAEYDIERTVGNERILANIVPIKADGQVLGAITSFRDLTEIKSLAEELTGVKKYVEALRVQNHEFSNKLHTILGLLQLKEYEKAIEYISQVSDYHQGFVSFITQRIKDPAIGGLILGKKGRCRELGIELEVDKDSFLGLLKNIDYNDMVAIVGNLIENAMESVMMTPNLKKIIDFSIFDESNKIFISVADNGSGIPEEAFEKVFLKGFSTKGTEKRGYGLHLVKSLVESYNGEIYFDSQVSIGTEFVVTIPNEVKKQ